MSNNQNRRRSKSLTLIGEDGNPITIKADNIVGVRECSVTAPGLKGLNMLASSGLRNGTEFGGSEIRYYDPKADRESFFRTLHSSKTVNQGAFLDDETRADLDLTNHIPTARCVLGAYAAVKESGPDLVPDHLRPMIEKDVGTALKRNGLQALLHAALGEDTKKLTPASLLETALEHKAAGNLNLALDYSPESAAAIKSAVASKARS